MHEVCSCGFPHSDIPGSMDICSSPGLFAACHVFLRLSVPRHPPCALFSLTSSGRVASRPSRSVRSFLLLRCLSDDLLYHLLSMRFSRYVRDTVRDARAFGVFPVCPFYFLFSVSTGDGEIRTLDPLLARQVLSQLSYTPVKIRHPPALPYRLQHSTIGRLCLNRRVRDGNGCFP